MKKQLLLLFLTVGLFFFSYSNHLVGVDVSYRHLKNLEYEITAVGYRDCRGTPNPPFDLYIYNDSFSTMGSPTRVKIEDVLYYCKNKPCTPSNTMTSKGVEGHYMIDTIDFASGIFKKFVSKNYCNVYFSISQCCRNGGIQGFNGNMFTEAMLNLCLATNSAVNSPRFVNTIPYFAACNQTLSYSFYANNTISGDSVSYALVKAKNDANYYENYSGISEKIPLTPYCIPPGTFNCTPSTTNVPVKGTTFDERNGNFLVTPTNCGEITTIVCQVNVYRKDSGKFKLAGYSKRDMMLIIEQSAINKPSLTTYKDYVIKARENFCTDIKIKDDTTASNKDTVKLVLHKFPENGTLSLLDSNAREKTLRFCWNATDDDYINKRQANIVLYAYDKPCKLGQSMSTTIHFRVAAPDSFTNIQIRTFFDRNRNGKKDASEPFLSAPVLSNYKGTLYGLQTDANGSLNLKQFYGNYIFNINRSQFVYPTNKDTILSSGFDSSHTVLLGFNYTQGLKGKAFEDVNNNCAFDAGTDIPLNGFKIVAQNGNACAFTDASGDYLFNNVAGTYILDVDSTGLYDNICDPPLSGTIVKDSQFLNYNFPLRKKSGFSNISVLLKPQTHKRDNSQLTQVITVENKGGLIVKQFYIKLLPSRTLYQFNSVPASTANKDTFFWLIDSIMPGTKKTFNFTHFLLTDSFTNGDQITYKIWAGLNDDVKRDNYYELTETVNDFNCCKTAKTVFETPVKGYPFNTVTTYRLFFNPAKPTKRALISDELDTNRFDLRSLQILSTNNNPTIYLDHTILKAEFSSSNFLGNVELAYSIALKTPVTDSFTVYNSAGCHFDDQPLLSTNNTFVKIVSPFLFDSLPANTYCANQTTTLGIQCNYKPLPGNRFKVYMSDSIGNFSQPALLLDTATTSLNPKFTFQLPLVSGSHSYKLKVIGSNPEVEAFQSIPLPLITVHPLPAIQYTTNLINGSICKNDTLHIKASGAETYRFYSFRNGYTNYSPDSTYSERLTDYSNYRIDYRSQKGCLNTSPFISASVYNLPEVSLEPFYTILCDNGEKLNLTFSGAQTYDLFMDKTTLIQAGLTSSPYNLTLSAGKHYYTMTGVDKNGCKDTSEKIFIQLIPLSAKPVITQIGKALVSSYTINNQWYDTGGRIDFEFNQYFYPWKNGKYYVKHIDSNGCENISDEYNVNFISIQKIVYKNIFTIYPNPAEGYISIENKSGIQYSWQLSDAFGRLLLNNVSEDNIHTIALEGLASGNYNLRIRTAGEIYNYKVVVLNQSR